MDKRSWPWKRKSSEKTSTTDATATSNKGDQGKTQNVQISAESYAHLTETEAQVKVLNEKLSSVQSEITTKDSLVKQHARVAEEAIAGWEKAEAETAALKTQLESVMLLKLTAEDRAAHLDDALKESIQQMHIVKEESEQMLHDTIFAKTKQWEAIKSELEEKIADFQQELMRNNAENAALSRSLQERSSMLIRISEEKSQAEAEIEVLKSGIQSCEKEINSLKYEVHVVTKELEIRNEEKNMSLRLAETANKQHIEDVKKISKLEAECQRLRGLVKKKLPGPAALAQMKLEVENLGRDYGETRLRRSPAKNSSYLAPSLHNFSLEDMHQCQKENEYLTACLLAAEEETNRLKETLSKRNNELHATRTFCAKTASKLRSAEAQVLGMNQQKEISFEGSLSQNQSIPSYASISEDGIDEVGSLSESCSVSQMSEISQLKENNVEKSIKANKSKHMELMDDFLEMERLACFSTEINGTITNSPSGKDIMNGKSSEDAIQVNGGKVEPGNGEQSVGSTVIDSNNILLSKLKSRITSLFEAGTLERNIGIFLEDISRIVQDAHDELRAHPSKFTNEEAHSRNATSEQENCSKDVGEAADKLCSNKHTIDEELKKAISQIQGIVVPLCKEAVEIQGRSFDDHVLQEKIVALYTSINRVLSDEINLDSFIFALSHMLSETRDVRFNMLANKGNEGEGNTNDCIDKLTLLEKRIAQHEPAKPKKSGESGILSPSSSNPANSQGVNSPAFEPQATSQNFYLDGYEQMKLEKDRYELELGRSTDTSERAKLQLVEMEQQLAELKSQVAACQKSNSLADTQLKCMAESYKSLESQTQELETELNLLRSKAEALDNELQEERQSHQDDLTKYNDLQEQMERETRCQLCSLHTDADVEKAKQNREIAAAAAEKLAECQETILLLGRQLKAMQPPTETTSSLADKLQNDYPFQGEPSPSGYSLQSVLNTAQPDQTSMDMHATGDGDGDSPLDGYNSHFSASDFEALPPRPDSSSKHQKNRARLASSSSLSSMLSAKQSRGFSRFFSRGKSDH